MKNRKGIFIFLVSIILMSCHLSIFSETVKKTIFIIDTDRHFFRTDKKDTATGYQTASFSVEKLIAAAPGIKNIANIKSDQSLQISSQAMTNEIWLKLAKRVNELINKPDVHGIVIIHNTDTMEETAYFLSLIINSKKPVVLVGTAKPETSVLSDGLVNLYQAIVLAASSKSKGKGTFLLLNDEIHSAREGTKTNTSGIDTLLSVNSGPLGYIVDENVYFYQKSTKKHTYNSEFNISNISSLPKVDIIYGYANCGREAVDAFVKNGAKGIILAGTGNGNPHPDAMQGLIDAEKKGVIIVRSSRCGSGIVTKEAEVDDQKHRFISANSLNPQKARVLLITSLTKTGKWKEIQSFFDEY
ncbi:MAG: type II asparaginase [bacterium]|nr:type II asparaginase [bacterium]